MDEEGRLGEPPLKESWRIVEHELCVSDVFHTHNLQARCIHFVAYGRQLLANESVH